MSNFKGLLPLSLFALLLISSCTQDADGIFGEEIITPEPQEIVNTSVSGRVIDQNDQPISNALVTLQSGTEAADVMTDEFGQFAFDHIVNKGSSAFLSIQSSGKFEAFRRLGVVKERYNYTEVKMQEKDIIGTVSAAQGGILSNGNNAEIELPANGIIDATGAAYQGDVSVAMAWIDPSAADLAAQMVGDLSAIDLEGTTRSLATYGMLQVELLDQSGNELNIASGSTATLQFPVPTSMQASAPATIPLWSYEEELGTWIEEGSATYQDGVYRGSVSHFSSWNVDYPYDVIEVTGEVKFNIEGAPVEGGYLSVYVESDEIGKKGGWLCDDGSFRFYNFPSGVDFKLLIYDQCGNVLYEETYGPYTSDKDLGAIVVENTNEMIIVSGNALDCSDEAISDGRIAATINGRDQYFKTAEDGTFEFALDICEEGDASITIVDLESLLQANFEVSSAQDVWEFPDTELCDELTDFISVTVDGGEPFIGTPQVILQVYQDSTGMGDVFNVVWSFEDQNSYASILLGFNDPGITPGTSDAFELSYFSNTVEYNMLYPGDIQVTVTEYMNYSGGHIKGNFTGVVKDGLTGTTNIPIEGEFHVPIN